MFRIPLIAFASLFLAVALVAKAPAAEPTTDLEALTLEIMVSAYQVADYDSVETLFGKLSPENKKKFLQEAVAMSKVIFGRDLREGEMPQTALDLIHLLAVNTNTNPKPKMEEMPAIHMQWAETKQQQTQLLARLTLSLFEQPTTKTQNEPVKRQVANNTPQLAVEVEKPKTADIGQEIIYRIKVMNTGSVPVERSILYAEIPAWIKVKDMETSNGSVSMLFREEGKSDIVDLTWKMSRPIEPGGIENLVLRIVPQQRRAIEIPISIDTFAKTETQEPQLKLELLGADEVSSDDNTVYTLLVRNVGKSNVENLKLILQRNGSSEAASCTLSESLRQGESQEISIQVHPGKEQEYIDIAVLAMGSQDLKGEVKRRIRVVR
jgi:hypothetical protein